ncbi:AAA family ATPase [Mediterraneibacter glycyrrhizinilyticus]|uniref:AAA family ATPase n=1 Tax=Mediterraneibacter glycyrrhizinilyticus TaxID=342942 RepID=UPI0025AAE8D2|nr:AAA family ATPase [Mediterraneibacter glycyrrhizinilyticus]MDN0045010.1 AAA family ATPase [Mediterraneibacter glycyrrhizinilyticus]
MRLKELQIYNRAPFDDLKLNFNKENVFILSGINGAGKTTILSYIVDALYEFAKKGFQNEFTGKEQYFYRVSSKLMILESSKISFVYLRFEENEDIIDYIDVMNLNSEQEYNAALKIDDAIAYANIESKFKSNQVVKYFNKIDQIEIKKYFDNNVLTYFPAYRYEKPGYLSDPYNISLSFAKEQKYFGYLSNPIEVTSDFPEIANWMMDLVLDDYLYEDKNSAGNIFSKINEIFTRLLYSKVNGAVRLGIGPRQYGATRIQVVSKLDNQVIYPSLFNMSAGELSLVCLFCEILRQGDNIGRDSNEVKGIVLVDEIDKHLHIKLQKEVLPRLIKLFPNIQFILTSHSPFLNLGFSNEPKGYYEIWDLDNYGLPCKPQNNKLFEEVYGMLVDENEQYRKQYYALMLGIQNATKPLIITEGKTDWKHLQAAKNALEISDLEIEFCKYNEAIGDETLLSMLNQFSLTLPNRKIIGMFDRDNEKICKEIIDGAKSFVKLSQNIYAFAIPVANEKEYGTYTSIEHYYKKKDLVKETKDGRRLFLGNEFYTSGNSKDGMYQTRYKGIQKKVAVNGVIDDKVYGKEDPELKNNIALSKNDFAQMILDKDDFAKDFDFSEFNRIFDVIRNIISVD